MDKETLSNYGWVVICILVIAILIGMSTPFASALSKGVKSSTNTLMETADNSLGNITKYESFEEMGAGAGSGSGEVVVPGGGGGSGADAVDPVLENNSWETIQKVVSEGRAQEVGWSIGDTKTLNINGEVKTARIIGFDHDAENSATFMLVEHISEDGRDAKWSNEGGWEESFMRSWLNGTVYDSMTDVKDYIKPVSKMSNNLGFGGQVATETTDKVFLLSVKEIGMFDQISSCWDINAVAAEGSEYAWFADGNIVNEPGCDGTYVFLRTAAYGEYENGICFYYNYTFDGSAAILTGNELDWPNPIFPAFVIG